MEWTDEQRRAFAELMRTARERTGLKQFEVADRLDMAHGTISQLERGPFMGMRWVDVTRLLAFYGVTPDQVRAVLGLDESPAAREAVEVFVLQTALEGLGAEEREEVERVVRLLVRGLRAKE